MGGVSGRGTLRSGCWSQGGICGQGGGGGSGKRGAWSTTIEREREGETQRGASAHVALRVTLVPEYPSHYPPTIESLEGVGLEGAFSASESHAKHALYRLFFEQRDERLAAGGDDEPAVLLPTSRCAGP